MLGSDIYVKPKIIFGIKLWEPNRTVNVSWHTISYFMILWFQPYSMMKTF